MFPGKRFCQHFLMENALLLFPSLSAYKLWLLNTHQTFDNKHPVLSVSHILCCLYLSKYVVCQSKQNLLELSEPQSKSWGPKLL